MKYRLRKEYVEKLYMSFGIIFAVTIFCVFIHLAVFVADFNNELGYMVNFYFPVIAIFLVSSIILFLFFVTLLISSCLFEKKPNIEYAGHEKREREKRMQNH